MACGILVPRPRIKPLPSAVEAWSPNHQITRELPQNILNLKTKHFFLIIKSTHVHYGKLENV